MPLAEQKEAYLKALAEQKEALLKAFLRYLEEEEASRHTSLDFIMQDLEAIVRTKDLLRRDLDSIDFGETM